MKNKNINKTIKPKKLTKYETWTISHPYKTRMKSKSSNKKYRG